MSIEEQKRQRARAMLEACRRVMTSHPVDLPTLGQMETLAATLDAYMSFPPIRHRETALAEHLPEFY